MTGSREPSRVLLRGYLFAHLLTGCREGALNAVREAAGDFSKHPAATDPERTDELFLSCVRKRSLRFPARSDLPPHLLDLHREGEPERSARVLRTLGFLDDAAIGRLIGVPVQARSSSEAGSLSGQDLADLEPDEDGQEDLRVLANSFGQARSGLVRLARNPATLAVGAGFLLLVVVGIWLMTGRAGVFPEDAFDLSAQARKADPEQFVPVELDARAVADWFAMNGIEGVFVPEPFHDFEAVGLRTFKYESEDIAQIAALDGDVRFYFLVFAAEPFGMGWLPEGAWQTATSRGSALALQRQGGMCFLVSTSLSLAELKSLLAHAGRDRT